MFGGLLSILALLPLLGQVESIMLFVVLGIITLTFIPTMVRLIRLTKQTGFKWQTTFQLVVLGGVFIWMSYGFLEGQANLYVLGVLAAVVTINYVFNELLKKRTLLGQKINSEALGFELFLKAAEEDRLNFRNPPDKTPALFERFLPYALALNLDQAWANQFTQSLTRANYAPS